MNALKLVQTTPAINAETNVVQVTVTGAYVSGTADPIDLTKITDPNILGQVPMDNPTQNPPPVTPSIRNCYAPGFYAQVQRIVNGKLTTFGLRWFQLSTGAELASANYPAAILAAEIFLDILVPTQKQA